MMQLGWVACRSLELMLKLRYFVTIFCKYSYVICIILTLGKGSLSKE